MSNVILNQTAQPAHDVLRTSPEGPLKFLTSRTNKGFSGDPQGTNTKTDDLMKKMFFRSNGPCITYLFLLFYRKNKYSKVLNGDDHGAFTGPSYRMSRGPNDETF